MPTVMLMRSNPPRPTRPQLPRPPLPNPFDVAVNLIGAMQSAGVNFVIAAAELPWRLAAPILNPAKLTSQEDENGYTDTDISGPTHT